jgi:TonB family protein
MFCSNCGAHISEKDLTCKFCGFTNQNLNKINTDEDEQDADVTREPTLKDLIEKNLYNTAQKHKNPPEAEGFRESPQPPKQFQAENFESKKGRSPTNQKQIPLIMSLIIILFLISSAATYYLVNNSENEGSLQFSRAEELFENQNYHQALMAYGKFLREFPESPLASSARKKTTEINRILKEIDAENKRILAEIAPLMAKADKAFQTRKLLVPPKDNAYLYLTEIFALDPNYKPAKDMQQDIVDYYLQLANVAMESKKYGLAVRNFDSSLKFKPEDPQIAKMRDSTLVLQNKEFAQYQMLLEQKQDSSDNTILASLDSLSYNSLDIRQLVQDDSEPLELNNVQNKEPQNPTVSTYEYSSPTAATSNQEPIIEALIDGGTRQYLHREKPLMPSWLKYEGIHKIRVECVVDTDGRVEKVSLMKPSTNKALNKLAVDTFERYKYKPATFQGNPARFKVVEIIIFR